MIVPSISTTLWEFYIREFPLELYHLPNFLLAIQRRLSPKLAPRLRRESLAPAARVRAAYLRERAGIDPPALTKAPATSSESSQPTDEHACSA